jgi:hypothetical protein
MQEHLAGRAFTKRKSVLWHLMRIFSRKSEAELAGQKNLKGWNYHE